jgi:hypothetical protein
MNSLSDVASKTRRYFCVVPNISVISIGQKAAQQRESKAMAVNLVAGSP